MIIISTGDTSLGLKLSLSFKVQLLLVFFFVFFSSLQHAVGAKWAKGEQGHGSARTAEGSHHPRAMNSAGERFALLRGRVKSLMPWHTRLLRRLDV